MPVICFSKKGKINCFYKGSTHKGKTVDSLVMRNASIGKVRNEVDHVVIDDPSNGEDFTCVPVGNKIAYKNKRNIVRLASFLTIQSPEKTVVGW